MLQVKAAPAGLVVDGRPSTSQAQGSPWKPRKVRGRAWITSRLLVHPTAARHPPASSPDTQADYDPLLLMDTLRPLPINPARLPPVNRRKPVNTPAR